MKKFLSILAFVGLICVAGALLLAQLLSWIGVTATVTTVFLTIGQIFAYIVTMVYAFHFVRGKRRPIWWVLYWVSVVVILLLVILQICGK